MAAVCYTCYRPARTGYVRQSIALILALGAAHTECVSVVVCTAVLLVYPIPFHPLATIHRPYVLPLVPLAPRHPPPLFAGTTSPSDYLHLAPPRWCYRRRILMHSPARDRFLNPLRLVSRASSRKPSFRKSREIDVSKRRTSTRSSVISVFGSSFVLYRRAISAEFQSCLKSHKSFTVLSNNFELCIENTNVVIQRL